jgi:hypothetical protein
VASNTKGPPRMGGHTEAKIADWRNENGCATIMVLADALYEGMSDEDARKQVYDEPFPEDSRDTVTRFSIGVLDEGHCYLVYFNGSGVHEVGDPYQRALSYTLDKLRKGRKRTVDLETALKVKDATKRFDLLKESLNCRRQPPKNPAAQKQQQSSANTKQQAAEQKAEWQNMAKENGWVKKGGKATTGDQPQQEEWQKAAAANGWVKAGGNAKTDDQQQQKDWKKEAEANGWVKAGGGNAKADGQSLPASSWTQVVGRKPRKAQMWEAGVVSAIVLHTQAPKDAVLGEIARFDQQVAKLIHSVRQKEGHLVLMAKEADSDKLKQCLPGFKSWGFKAQPYRRKPALSQVSQAGAQAKMQATPYCNNFLRGVECGYGDKCRFKCVLAGG